MKIQKIKKDILPEVNQIAVDAGKILIRFSKKINKLKITSKAAEGMVSLADIETERFIEKKLKKLFPSASFLGEESSFIKGIKKKDVFKNLKSIEWCWIVDPLDGTHNFLNGLDYYGVCISLAHFGVPILGVVYRPEREDIYYAVQGYGAFKEELSLKKKKKIHFLKNTKKLKDCMVVTGFSLEKGIDDPAEFKYLKKVMKNCRGVRRFGSAALDMCLVAEGKFDSFWEKGLSPWDVAASGVICLEAGVLVTDYNANEFHPFQDSIICARKPLYKSLISIF